MRRRRRCRRFCRRSSAKIKASFEEAKASGTKPDFQQMRTLHQQLQQETLQKLTPVLSSAQLKKFQVLAQMQHRHFGHFGGGPPGAAAAPGAELISRPQRRAGRTAVEPAGVPRR